MTEQLLQFIWRFQYFNRSELCTVDGEPVMVISPGLLNRDQGPDFTGAVLMVGGLRWAGTVELHLRTGDWLRHRHQHDRNYGSVILHVVWQHDVVVNQLPVVELRERIPRLLLEQYAKLMANEELIPCNANTSQLSRPGWTGWKDRLLFERLHRKSALITAFNEANGHNWEETCWWLLARNFGIKVNADAFEMIARSVPVTVLARLKNNLVALEALLLGQGGLLTGTGHDGYLRLLQGEYQVLKMKYSLEPVALPLQHLRMRPGNFPAVRLAQLAGLVHRLGDLRSVLCNTGSLKDMEKMLLTPASDYWNTHYQPGKQAGNRPKTTGKSMIHNLVINTVVPLLFYLSDGSNDETYACRAIDWLHELDRETNSVTDSLERIGFAQEDAFDSQAMIELKSQYCDQRKCLDCAVGYSILNPRLPSRC